MAAEPRFRGPGPRYKIAILERFRTPRSPGPGAITGERSPENAG